MRAWSRKLGYKSHRTLGMILSGDRAPTPQFVGKVAKLQNLSAQELTYLNGLIARRCGRDDLELDLDKVKNPLGEFRELTEAEFAQMSDWYFFVIKQLIQAPSFRLEKKYLVSRLPEGFPLSRFKSVLQTLLRLNLIAYDPKTRRFSEVSGQVRTTHDVPSATLRKFHRQWLARAAYAIEHTPLPERDNLTYTFRGDRKRIGEMKEFLRYMRNEFARKFDHDPDAEDVIQLLIHLFPCTQALPEEKP